MKSKKRRSLLPLYCYTPEFAAQFTNESHQLGKKNPAAGVLIYCKTTGRYLIHRRGFKTWEGGRFDTYGGGIDGNETPLAAAVRELEEESGLKANPRDLINVGVYNDANGPYHFFLWIIDKEVAPKKKNTREVASWNWYSRMDTMKLHLTLRMRWILANSHRLKQEMRKITREKLVAEMRIQKQKEFRAKQRLMEEEQFLKQNEEKD